MAAVGPDGPPLHSPDHWCYLMKSDSIRRVSAIRTKPLPVPLDQPARLRVGHLMFLYLCSHTTIYNKLRDGLIPPPDGHDPRPYWLTSTIRPEFAEKGGDHEA